MVRRVVAIVALPMVSAIAWAGFFYAIYGTPDPRAAYGGYTQTALENVPRGVVGLLFDQQFGVLPNAPVYLVALLGFWTLCRTHARLAVELALLVGTYGVAVAAYAMWWGGYSAAARFLVPILMPLSIPAAMWFRSSRGRAARLLGIATLVVSLLITAAICLVDRGAMMFNVRTSPSRFWTWLSPLVDVTSALPSVFRTEPGTAAVHALVWLTAIGGTAAAGALVTRRGGSMSSAALVMGVAGAVAGMTAMTVVWRSNDAAPLRPVSGSLAFLDRYDPDSHQTAVRYQPLGRMSLADVPARLPLVDVQPGRTNDSTIAFLEHVPAGRYAIDGVKAASAAGDVTVVLDRQFGAAWTWTLATEHGHWRREFQLPVDVRALALAADNGLRAGLERVSMRAVSIAGGRKRASDRVAADVVRYGPVLVFLTHGLAYMEPTGVWVGGGEEADFVISTDAPRPLRLFLRNVPLENDVTVDIGDGRSGDWRSGAGRFALQPGEERTFDVPATEDGHSATIRVAAARGAKPIDFEKGSTDTRLLGVWVEVR
jgi:hypothetical protein